MKHGAMWKISVTTTAEAADATAEWLGQVLGQPAVTDINFATGKTVVSVYCETEPRAFSTKHNALRAGLRRIKSCGLDVGTGRISIKKFPREDWAESWKRHFKPIAIGDALLIKPSWSKRRPRRGQVVVVLDPGLSFGTGQHPTTEFCLRELVRRHLSLNRPTPDPSQEGNCRRASAVLFPSREGSGVGSSVQGRFEKSRRRSMISFLDIGTGSGILAIAAAKLGYAPVHAFDFDPQSVQIARANARANRVQHKLRITRADLTRLTGQPARQYDVICANLLANLLIAGRDRIIARLKPGGALVVAGILKSEFAEVAAAFKDAGFRVVASKAQKEWRSGTFTNRIFPGAKSKS